MDELLKLRFQARDRELVDGFLKAQDEMNSRGLLQSSITVQKLHEVARTEFDESRKVIVDTIMDAINQSLIGFDRQQLDEIARQKLADRKCQIESQLESLNRSVLRSLQNSSMIAPYMTLDQYNALALSEISVRLTRSLDQYQARRGTTTRDRIVNKLLDNKIVAVIVIVFAALTFALGFLALYKTATE